MVPTNDRGLPPGALAFIYADPHAIENWYRMKEIDRRAAEIYEEMTKKSGV